MGTTHNGPRGGDVDTFTCVLYHPTYDKRLLIGAATPEKTGESHAARSMLVPSAMQNHITTTMSAFGVILCCDAELRCSCLNLVEAEFVPFKFWTYSVPIQNVRSVPR